MIPVLFQKLQLFERITGTMPKEDVSITHPKAIRRSLETLLCLVRIHTLELFSMWRMEELLQLKGILRMQYIQEAMH